MDTRTRRYVLRRGGSGALALGLGPWALGLGPWALGLGPWALALGGSGARARDDRPTARRPAGDGRRMTGVA
ncbi:hypothetical protein D0B32_06970 [Paraburkholderia sp. DHOC27]|nr:hypothetical protein D0B32_06970 [Paraburkholderia sp. DHOC27]